MKLFLALLALGALGWTGGTALAHDDGYFRPPGYAYQAGYQRGYQHGYQHGYHDAVSGLDYENVAESHGAEAYGPYGAGMHEGEHAGYEDGFRAGSAQHHHHHHGFFREIFGDDGER